MYYYAVIELESGICYDIYEAEYQITDDPSCIEIDSYDKSYMFRKKYIDGVWVNTTPAEAQQFEGSHIGINGEWLDVVIDSKADINHTHDGYANADHTHTEYASSNNLQVLEDMIDAKADSVHSHSEYSPSNHIHNDYATQIDLDSLSEEIEGKANENHSHTEYALTTHEHNYASSNHNHNTVYAPLSHSHSNYVTTTDFDSLEAEVEDKADKGHTHSNYSETTHKHDNVYAPLAHSHTASEIGAAVSGHNHDSDYADIEHNHNDVYAEVGHNHNEDYSAINHSHSNYATVTSLDELSATVSGKANASHSHTIANITNLQSTLDGKAATSHGTHVSYSTTAPVMDGTASVGTASTVARSDHKHPTDTTRAAQTDLDTLETVVAGKANASHTHTIANVSNLQAALDGKSATSHTHSAATASAAGFMSASDKSKLDGIASGANKYTLPTASSTLGGVKTTSTVTSNSGYTACPIIEGVPYYKDTNTTYSLGSFGVTATAAELNYMDGVTSNVQTQLDGKAASSHGTHVSYGTTAPKANGTAAVGTASTVSRSDHVHPLQTTVSGNAGTATKLANARTISLTGDVSGSTTFDGSGNVSITTTIADDSHNHIISNVDGLQSALDGKSATSHNHNSAYISKNLQFTSDQGSFKLSYTKDDNKNLLTEMANLPIGFYTIYSQSGVTGNPKTTEAWRLMFHKTGTSNGWVQAYGSIGSVYANYLDASSWRGWKCIWDNDPNPLWSGQYYMSSPNSTPQTVTPSKKLSECRTGWLLLWSDYDAGSGSNDSDFVTTIIPKNNPSGGTWGGKSFLCDIPRYVGSNAEDVDTESRIIKPIYVHDDCIKGSYQNDKDERNDVVLRAVYEI